ncbi:SCO1860 family LAETG-anchored protein, partial [Streptomyces sp. NPDC049577]|uniref:SCO1860 family LAETG-anchored protein n=1 Tax=Streptomyces sp. NPDC049577 TaxID=3155153 RepID=UPI00341418C7
MPARRRTALAATATATALALAAAPAHATGTPTGGDTGQADAVVLRAGLDVSLLGGRAHVPVETSLDDVHAPASADRTTLTVTLDGVEQGRPVGILRADAATARATTGQGTAKGYAHLVHAKVHVPGLPVLSLVEIGQVTSEAVCEAGKKPVASSNLPGDVVVLGRRVTLSATGPTKVDVPGVGQVRLDLSKTATTTRTAAATALRLEVSVDPLKLNVAQVRGNVTLAEAHCETPGAGQEATAGKPLALPASA